MALASFSLPIDIPWQRIAFSRDMMDKKACDRELPLRWRSSVAVFEYQPPDDQQRTDGFIVSYLKVACTITGYQAEGSEIRIRERLGRSGWDKDDLTDKLGEAAAKYYACYGAMLEVVVAPHAGDDRFGLAEYPYFADFDPKKRELFEIVTETGETMSRSLEDVNVRLGQTTLQSHEVRDTTNLAGEVSGMYGSASGSNIAARGSASNESGTTDLNQQTTENVRTTDAAREARETFSHTTQLSQMYHQLNSYHLGTNRAAFFVLPRPHTVQSSATFVNGPREIEGVQEFMLVVVRPREMESFCVEAYLETAHLTGKPILDEGQTETELTLHVETPDTNRQVGSRTSTRYPDYVIDTKRGPQGWPPGAEPHGDTGGYRLGPVNITMNGGYTFIVGKETVTVNGYAEGLKVQHPPETFGSALDLTATVYLKKKVPTIDGYLPGLMITGRSVCSCSTLELSKARISDQYVVFEKSLDNDETQPLGERDSMSIGKANRMGANLKRELLESVSSADRYPRGTVGLLDTQLIAGMLGTHIRHADREVNPRLMDLPGINKEVARRVTQYAPTITRSELLEMPLVQQVEKFALSFDEAVGLRRTLSDLREPKGSPPMPQRHELAVPLVIGMQLYEARAALATAGLLFGGMTQVDSPLPSGSVIAQEPQAGTVVETTKEITVQVASGLSVRLPNVMGSGLLEAACSLRDAGLRREPTVEGKPVPNAVVVGMEPPAGTLIMPSSAVTIRLEHRKHASRLPKGKRRPRG